MLDNSAPGTSAAPDPLSREQFSVPVIPGSPPELVVYDRPCACPYLRDRVARMPLRLPTRRLRRTEVDQRLMTGDRRQGLVLYRTHCPTCSACVPIRIPVASFELNRTHRRVLSRGDRELQLTVGAPVLDQQRVDLYNAHKQARGLAEGQSPIDLEGYEDFLVNSCCESFELRYHLDGKLVGIAITDRGQRALSAVYCFYDPGMARWSVGTYSILKQIELCRRLGLAYLYLGLYIEESPAMRYKATFLPHEQLLDGGWVRFGKRTTIKR